MRFLNLPTFYSDQITAIEYTKPQSLQASAAWGGKLRVKEFTWTGDAAQNDFVQLCKLPKGARILFGKVDYTDAGGATTMDIGDMSVAGVSATENKYLSAGDISGQTGVLDFAHTWALYGLGREALATDIYLTAKIEAADPASMSLRGFVAYVVE